MRFLETVDFERIEPGFEFLIFSPPFNLKHALIKGGVQYLFPPWLECNFVTNLIRDFHLTYCYKIHAFCHVSFIT